jgi:hypothetical protein
MSANAAVRDRVVEAVLGGKLPGRSADRTWAGPGCGATCAICGRPVGADEREYELEFVTGDNGKQPAHYHLHNGCFWAWESELRKPQSKRSAARAVELSGAVADAMLAEDGRDLGTQGST